MTRHFHRDLEHLKKEVLALGALVENALSTATTALTTTPCKTAARTSFPKSIHIRPWRSGGEAVSRLIARSSPRALSRSAEAPLDWITVLSRRHGDSALFFPVVPARPGGQTRRSGTLPFNRAGRALPGRIRAA